MTEIFEAREKKIGSITIKKNPNFPSGTSLQAYIKTNRAELRKVFGNPNMGESGDGKSKGKERNLWVGGKRVTIYDKREKGKKGTKYFNIGGRGKFGALLVAQALSIHRNERVHAKETVPKWLEDKGHHQEVKSIDEHPDLTYQRAKEYWENTGRYGAEGDYSAESFEASSKWAGFCSKCKKWRTKEMSRRPSEFNLEKKDYHLAGKLLCGKFVQRGGEGVRVHGIQHYTGQSDKICATPLTKGKNAESFSEMNKQCVECENMVAATDGDNYFVCDACVERMGAETSGQWEIGEQLDEAQMNAEEFDRGIEDKKGHINYWNEKDRMQKYFKNWKPKSSPYEKRVVAETKTKWCENCGELDDNEEENWPWYQWVLKQKNSSKASFRWITGGACEGCGSDLCQNCLDGNTSGNFNPLFEPTCEDCGGAFCKECKDEDEDRCNTCQEEYEENVCDCCGYLHHAESFGAEEFGADEEWLARIVQSQYEGVRVKIPISIQEDMDGDFIIELELTNGAKQTIIAEHGDIQRYGAESFSANGYRNDKTMCASCGASKLSGGGQCNMCRNDNCWDCLCHCCDDRCKHCCDNRFGAESFSAPTKGIDTFTKPFEESSLDSGTVKKVLVGLGIGALALIGYNKWK